MAIPTKLLDLIKPYTKSSIERLDSMYSILMTVDKEKIKGDIVECGVWRGGNILLARMLCPNRTCWLYDTFDGMTIPDEKLDIKQNAGYRAIDRYNLKLKGGAKWDAISLEEVRRTFNKMNLENNCNFIVGPLEETVYSSSPDQIAVLRLDMDWHCPTKVALQQLYPKLESGGFLIVDDYGHWLGCRKAVDDYFGKSRPEMKQIDYSCVVIRKCL